MHIGSTLRVIVSNVYLGACMQVWSHWCVLVRGMQAVSGWFEWGKKEGSWVECDGLRWKQVPDLR